MTYYRPQDTLSKELNLSKISAKIVAYIDFDSAKIDTINKYCKCAVELKLYEKIGAKIKLQSCNEELLNSYHELVNIFPSKYTEIQEFLKKESDGFNFPYYLENMKILQQVFPNNLGAICITDWYLEFILNGPDLRYSKGFVTLKREEIEKLLSGLREGLEKMKALTQSEFSGFYNKRIDSLNRPSLEVISENKKTALRFFISSPTQLLYQEFNISELSDVIDKINTANYEAEKLMGDLEKLCF